MNRTHTQETDTQDAIQSATEHLAKGLELTASRRIRSGWRRRGCTWVAHELPHDVAAAVIDRYRDRYHVRNERMGRVLTPEPRDPRASRGMETTPIAFDASDGSAGDTPFGDSPGGRPEGEWWTIDDVIRHSHCELNRIQIKGWRRHDMVESALNDRGRIVLRLTDELRIRMGWMYRDVIEVDQPALTSVDLADRLGVAASGMYPGRFTPVDYPGPQPAQKAILVDDVLRAYLESRDTRLIYDHPWSATQEQWDAVWYIDTLVSARDIARRAEVPEAEVCAALDRMHARWRRDARLGVLYPPTRRLLRLLWMEWGVRAWTEEDNVSPPRRVLLAPDREWVAMTELCDLLGLTYKAVSAGLKSADGVTLDKRRSHGQSARLHARIDDAFETLLKERWAYDLERRARPAEAYAA